MQALGSLIRDQEQFSGLDAGLPIAADDVGLHDHGHPGGQREVGRGYRPAGAGTTGGR